MIILVLARRAARLQRANRGILMDIATILIINSLISTCSIRETARQEGRAPSTVSAALERMETALAVPLMRREGAVLSLTLEAQSAADYLTKRRSLVVNCNLSVASPIIARPFLLLLSFAFLSQRKRGAYAQQPKPRHGAATTDPSALRTGAQSRLRFI